MSLYITRKGLVLAHWEGLRDRLSRYAIKTPRGCVGKKVLEGREDRASRNDLLLKLRGLVQGDKSDQIDIPCTLLRRS